MCVGVDRSDLIVRCEKEETDQLLANEGARVFDLSGGRPMKGWLLVGQEATRTPAGFQGWLDVALAWANRAGKAPKAAKARGLAKAKKVARAR